jgi:hypothetical protein
MDLTPEERERIYIEEKARLEVRQTLEAENKKAGFGSTRNHDSNKINNVVMPIMAGLAFIGIGTVFCVFFFPHTAVDVTHVAASEVAVSVMSSADQCPKDDNQIIDLAPGDRVQVLQHYQPESAADRALPKDSPLSKTMYLTYVKVLDGQHANEYCWASTANIQ